MEPNTATPALSETRANYLDRNLRCKNIDKKCYIFQLPGLKVHVYKYSKVWIQSIRCSQFGITIEWLFVERQIVQIDCLLVALDDHQRMLTASRNSGHAAVFGNYSFLRFFQAIVYGANDVQQPRTGNNAGGYVPVFIGFPILGIGNIVVSSLRIFVVSPGIHGSGVCDCKARNIPWKVQRLNG